MTSELVLSGLKTALHCERLIFLGDLKLASDIESEINEAQVHDLENLRADDLNQVQALPAAILAFAKIMKSRRGTSLGSNKERFPL